MRRWGGSSIGCSTSEGLPAEWKGGGNLPVSRPLSCCRGVLLFGNQPARAEPEDQQQNHPHRQQAHVLAESTRCALSGPSDRPAVMPPMTTGRGFPRSARPADQQPPRTAPQLLPDPPTITMTQTRKVKRSGLYSPGVSWPFIEVYMAPAMPTTAEPRMKTCR